MLASNKRRPVFIVSDSTGITAEAMAASLLSQFDGLDYEQVNIPFINSLEKAEATVQRIRQAALDSGIRPLVFGTVVNDEYRRKIQEAPALYQDFIDQYIGPLEHELGLKSNHTAGKAHSVENSASYKARIDAMNYALENDDGATLKNYDKADVILLGASRSGKTPTCLYLALQYGIFAANFPITDEDLENASLPKSLFPFRNKLFGLSISAEKLAQIRSERRPNSTYSSVKQCNFEVRAVDKLYQHERIPKLNATATSIEELSTHIVHEMKLTRRFF